ncbi:endonuclease/exonuclease/phosphatase family protein [Halosimplex marinum]|uniref:endonuclease/exonuclease/phosphatase family protein n=1 Tax=Halosimplex marinum TaxID=3396620 RepID=UPI003F55D667
MPSTTHSQPSRRAVLAGLAAAPTGLAGLAAGSARDAPARATVATWNAYLGVDLFALFDARSLEDVRTIAGDLLADARHHPYAARAGAVADGIVAAEADAVALQEAARLRSIPRDSAADDATAADGTATGDTAADGETVADLLDLVVEALADRGRPYEVAAEAVTTDVRLPADTDDGRVDVGFTDRVALLVREGVDARDARSGRYDERLTFPLFGTDRSVTLRRGYCFVDATLDGAPVTLGSTHLESASSRVRERQAEELVDALPDGPVVVGADLNSGPGGPTAAYDAVTAELTDAHTAVRPDEPGDTCCQPSRLRNDRSRLSKRVDAVLSTDSAEPRAVERLGADPEDRVEATVDGEDVTVWPSDHAGVAATVDLPGAATPTPTSTARSTATGTPTGTASPSGTPAESPTAERTDAATGTATPTRTAPVTAPAETTDGTGTGFGPLAALAALVGGTVGRGRDGDGD